jgi:hypothetical protein
MIICSGLSEHEKVIKMSYNGYTNYETWNVGVWIDNDEGLLDQIIDLTHHASEEPELAESIKEFVMDPETSLFPELPNGLASDILTNAISRIDWYEIAKSFWDEYAYTNDDEIDEE